jgi:hypothetical protein
MRQSLGGQRDHQRVEPGQTALALAHDLWLERAVAVSRDRDLDRPNVGEHAFGPRTVAGVAAVAAGRVMFGVAQVRIHLALGRRLDDRLGQLGQQPVLAGQPQPLRAGPIDKLPDQLLVELVQPHHVVRVGPLVRLIGNHISHSALLFPQELHRLSYRPQLAGRSDPLFTDDATTLIHESGRGKPRAVNRLAIAALIAACAADKNLIDEASARSAVTETNHDPQPAATP